MNSPPTDPQPSTLEGEWAAVLAECSEPNWDGYGAVPVSRRAIRHAREVLARLGDVPEPECGADPDGEASLDWHSEPGDVFTVSVSSEGRVAWAYLIHREGEEESGNGLSLVSEVAELIPKIRRVANVS